MRSHSLLILLILATCSCRVARAGLINSLLYHKYHHYHHHLHHPHHPHQRPYVAGIRPPQTTNTASAATASPATHLEPLNSSSSTVMEQFEMSDGSSPGVEYHSSPLNRIMELIGHHRPSVIVMQQSSSAEEKQQQQPAATAAASVPPPEVSGSSDQQQHWALLGPEGQQQVIQMAEQQELMRQQHQQQPVAATAVASFEANQPHIYLSSQALTAGDPTAALGGHHRLALVPYQPPAAYHQLPSFMPQQVQQMQQQQQQQLKPEQTQPIFLTSYVPEAAALQAAAARPPLLAPPKPSPPPVVQVAAQLAAPDSIQQQIQKQQKAAANLNTTNDSSSSDAAGEGESESDSKSAPGDQQQADKQQANREQDEDNDIEEPIAGGGGGANSKQAPNDAVDAGEPSDDLPSGSGSSNYAEKYDSDTMDEPNRSGGQPEVAESVNNARGLLAAGLNDDCLQCICRASSGCDYHLGCITRGATDKYCGPFQLTEEYWQKAGSPGDASNNFSAFEDCANEADCAVETITNYMKRHLKDCDGDQQITCMDYARLHRLRPDECHDTDKLDGHFDAYWAKFQRCAESYNRTRAPDEEDI